MSGKWVTAAAVSDTLSAQALCERLHAEGVSARVQSDSELLGAARQCRILVPQEALHRAKRILSEAPFTDAELAWLATGELGHGKEKDDGDG
jgi:hypothetical protein